MTRKKHVAPGLSEKTYSWYTETFDNPNQGVVYALESYPELYGRTLRDLRGVFTAGELSLMLDVQNGCLLMPQVAGQHLLADVEDGIALEGMAEKWKINGEALIEKIRRLKLFEIAMLEIWAGAFWRQEKPQIEPWVARLAKQAEGKKATK